MDGWIIVGTKLDSKQLEKDLKQAERRLQQYEKEAEKLTQQKSKLELDLQDYEEQKRLIQESTDEALKLAQTEEQVNNVLDMEKMQLEELNQKYSKQLNNLDEVNQKIQKNAKNQALVTNEIEETNRKLQQTKGYENIKNITDDIGKSLSNTVKKIGKMALTIFGIRTAYNAVRGAVSTLSQYNDQIKTDLEYIRFAVASTLQPVIERLIQLVYKLLSYINYIAKAWFGIDLFANASAKAMEKGSKSAEKMKKSLAGFDEMNVLNDNGTTGAMGALPSVDLSQIDGEVPEWIRWIAENKELILASLFGIATALTAIRLGLAPLKALGLGVAVTGLILGISSLLQYLKDPSWENFGGIIEGIGLAILGVGIIIGGVPAIVTGAIVTIFGIIIKYWEDIKSFFQRGIDFFTGASDTIHKIFGDTIGGIYDYFVRTAQRTLDWWDDIFKSIKGILDGIIKFVKGVFTGDWNMAWQGIKEIFSNIWKAITSTFKTAFKTITDLVITISSSVGNVISSTFKAVVNGILGAIENNLNSPIRTINTLIKTINKVPGINLSTLGTFKLPRLAVGGIVNMPGRGVPVGGAIAGEVSKEGVLPLTDSQAMEELGATIGRYITINANITNTMNGRVISRELQKINTNSDFARNS